MGTRAFTITHAEALAIIRLMNDAYKAGVRDAEWVNDAGRCSEHIKETQEKGVYGRVTDIDKYEWRRWKHNILLMKDVNFAESRAVEFTSRINNWFCTEGCLLPLAQDFYNQGLQDWNDYPVSRSVLGLESKRYPRWTRKGIKNRHFKQMWVDMQTFAYERSKQYVDVNSANSLTERKFETFMVQVWKALTYKAERKHILNQ